MWFCNKIALLFVYPLYMYILNRYDDVINSSIQVYNWSVRLRYKALSRRYFPLEVK